jgi:hypothetical protein
MSVGQEVVMEPSGSPVAAAASTEGAAQARVFARARRQEEREHSLGLIITISLSFILFAAAILLGGHAFIAPMLQQAAATRNANGTGEVVFTMPDGVFCRHLSFDNRTGDVTEDGIETCPGSSGRDQGAFSQFRWGAAH